MPTPPSPVTIPNALTYRSVAGRTTPLTNLEIDGNFAYVENVAELRLKISDFTSQAIIDKLNADSLSSSAGGIDSSLLRGSAPSAAALPSTVVVRDGTGKINASGVTADNFYGKADSAGLADKATVLFPSANINGVKFDGSANITIADSTKLAKAGDTATGKITFKTSDTSSASLSLPHGTAPTSPDNGDIWTTSSGQFNRIGGETRQVAYTTSNISGYASNVSGIVALSNGGTGAQTAAAARTNLGAAASGVNSDITRLTGLTTAITTAQGGTGLTAPGPSGNVLKSNGSSWYSAPDVAAVPNIYWTWGYFIQNTSWTTDGIETYNYLDVFPPVGYTMSDFGGGIASNADLRAVTAFDNYNYRYEFDSYCWWNALGDRVRIYNGVKQQEARPRVNYFFMWTK